MSSDIDRLARAIDEVGETLHDLNREFGETTARLGTMEKQVQRLTDVLIDGNGKAVVSRLILLERRTDEAESTLKELRISGSRLAMVEKRVEEAERDIRDLDETKISADLEPTKDRTSELARVEIERAKAKTAIGEALKSWGPFAVGLAGLLAALAALLKGNIP